MIKALLYDLDDTLLSNDLAEFLPAYSRRLITHFPPATDPARFLKALMHGTAAMRDNTDPGRVLFDQFADFFFPAMGWQFAEAWPRFLEFYRTSYRELRELTRPVPGARGLLEWSLEAGFQVVIATSPLFPLEAIRERLRWAGIDDLPFHLITAIETSRFSKPRPEYFAEILARLGLRPDEALLIGNDPADDLAPAAALGLPHFWIAPDGSTPPAHGRSAAQPVGVGDLAAFQRWAQAELRNFQPAPPPAAGLPFRLVGSVAAALTTLQPAAPADWLARPGPGEWSPTEIVCHLRDVDREVNLPRLQALAQNGNPFIPSADSDPWVAARNYQAQSGPEALQTFALARMEIVRRLRELPETTWGHTGRHALFGPTTLAELIGFALDHDRRHLAQIQAALAARRGDALGVTH